MDPIITRDDATGRYLYQDGSGLYKPFHLPGVELPYVAMTHYGQEVKVFMRPKTVGQPTAGTIRSTEDGLEIYTGVEWQNLSALLDPNQVLKPKFDIPEIDQDTTEEDYERAMAVVGK